MQDSVTVHMAATPERIWDLVSDVTKIGRYSPETFEAEWLEGATGPAAGAKFRGHVKRNGKGPIYWTTCTVLSSRARTRVRLRRRQRARSHSTCGGTSWSPPATAPMSPNPFPWPRRRRSACTGRSSDGPGARRTGTACAPPWNGSRPRSSSRLSRREAGAGAPRCGRRSSRPGRPRWRG